MSDVEMVCEICGRRDPQGATIETLSVDVSDVAGVPAGRLWYEVQHCLDVRVCRQGAEHEVKKFKERCGANGTD